MTLHYFLPKPELKQREKEHQKIKQIQTSKRTKTNPLNNANVHILSLLNYHTQQSRLV